VAIESDGTEQYRRMTVRERSRLRPQQLERLGWRYMPLWTIEVFTDPSACADRIGGYLGLEKPTVSSRHRYSQGFFEDDVEHLAVNQTEAIGSRSSSAPGNAGTSGTVAPASAAGPATTGSPDGEQLAAATRTKEADRMSADGDIQKTTPDARRTDSAAADADAGAHEEQGGAGVTAPAASNAVAVGVLPNKAAEDDPRRWGDRSDSYDHDSWLQEQKPPHWG
jgi:hypothetical protein